MKKSLGRGPLRGGWCYKMADELDDPRWRIILFLFLSHNYVIINVCGTSGLKRDAQDKIV